MTDVVLMDNHDEAYAVWSKAGVANRILIHVDAHHDMWWIPPDGSITIANFICPCLTQGMVREVYWVVPDQTWEVAASRKALLRHLREIVKEYPDSRSSFVVENKRVSAMLTGRPLTICSVEGLPLIDEDVLLDIDADYLMIPRVSHGEGGDTHGSLPWCWPEELLSRLAERRIRSSLATVANSVEGGYTPLKWKYLGDELAARLRGADAAGPLLKAMNLIRKGATAAAADAFEVAESRYLEAADLLPEGAVPQYHLAHLYLAMNRTGEARRRYAHAVALDASYRTAIDTAGVLYQSSGDAGAVEHALRRALQLDPDDAIAHFGLGRLAATRKQWTEAERSLRRCLAIDHDIVDAHRALGNVLGRRRRFDEAISAYERSMKLVLAGRKPLLGAIITNEAPSRVPADPQHSRTYALLADLHRRNGARAQAITGYRMSIALKYDPFPVRARLAWLYLMQRQWAASAREAWRAVASSPREIGHRALDVWWKARRLVGNT